MNDAHKDEETRRAVREGYSRIAEGQGSCCGPSQANPCGGPSLAEDISKVVGYADEDLQTAGEANLGLGCGNPVALASLAEGETVLDLGSGAGFDCFLAARRVGETGHVIGVDMTPSMLDRAREIARGAGYRNVEFRLGEIEHLPVADASVDAIISNCVINLAPDKGQVFREAFRALKPGGRIMVSDIVLEKDLPDAVRSSVAALVACVAGAIRKEDYLGAMRDAGFERVEIIEEKSYPVEMVTSDPEGRIIGEGLSIPAQESAEMAAAIKSVSVHAVRPGGCTCDCGCD